MNPLDQLAPLIDPEPISWWPPAPGWWLFGLRLAAACAAMVAVVWWLNVPAQDWFQWGWQQRALQLGLLVCAGLAAFAGGLLLTGLRPRHLRH